MRQVEEASEGLVVSGPESSEVGSGSNNLRNSATKTLEYSVQGKVVTCRRG